MTMAKTKQAPSAAQTAYENAKTAHAAAAEHAAKPNAKDADKAKAAALETAMKAAETALRTDNFTRLGIPRVKKTRAGIRSLRKLLNSRGYISTPEQKQKMLAGVKEAVAELENAVQASLTGQKDAVVSDDFTL